MISVIDQIFEIKILILSLCEDILIIVRNLLVSRPMNFSIFVNMYTLHW